jgi:hypothetical protein
MWRKTKAAAKRLANAETEVLSSADSRYSTDQLWEVFVALHQQRRKMLGQSGYFANTDFEQFLQRAFVPMENQIWADLLIINYEKKPLAAAIGFRSEDTYYLYQFGMDATRTRLPDLLQRNSASHGTRFKAV